MQIDHIRRTSNRKKGCVCFSCYPSNLLELKNKQVKVYLKRKVMRKSAAAAVLTAFYVFCG